MMSWFKKTQGSGEIRAKIEESKAQLQALEAQAAEAEEALGRPAPRRFSGHSRR